MPIVDLRPAKVAVRLPAWAAGLALLIAAMPLLVWTGELALALFPVSVGVSAARTSVVIQTEGQNHGMTAAEPLAGLRFLPAGAFHREYQVDGSDTTNNFTFDPAYFATFARSPYYRLQAFLRDESSYSRWENLRVTDSSGKVISSVSRPPDSALLALPPAFTLRAEVHRLETSRTVEFLEVGGGQLRIELNRNDRYVRVTETVVGGSPRELAQWFFPTDWRPPSAEVLALWTRAAAIAVALVLILVPIAALASHRPIPLHDRRILTASLPTAVAVLLAVTATLLGVAFSAGVFDRAPHVLDAISYAFQAKIFASGRLAAPAPPVNGAFPTPFTLVYHGRWFSQYPPATAALLAFGVIAHLPWLVEPLLAGAAVLLTFGVARRQFGTRTGLLAAALIATSPFLALQAGSFLSHVPAMCFAALCVYAATRYLERPQLRWALLGAGALGAIILTREIAAVLIGAPLVGMMAFHSNRLGRPDRWLHVSAALGCLVVAGLVYGLYDLSLTGSAFEPPRQLFNPGDHLGFGAGVGFYGLHTVAAGLVNTDELLTSLNITLFGWPFGIAMALMLMPFILVRPASWDVLHGSIVGTFVVAYVGYFYHGIALGPRYYFEALPSMAILAARGFVVLGRTAALLGERLGLPHGPGRGERAALVLVTLMLACNLVYFIPRQFELYRVYSGIPGRNELRPPGFVRYDVRGREPALSNALATTGDWWTYAVDLAPLNCPRLDCESVFAFAPDIATTNALASAFPARKVYAIQRRGDHLIAVPQAGG